MKSQHPERVDIVKPFRRKALQRDKEDASYKSQQLLTKGNSSRSLLRFPPHDFGQIAEIAAQPAPWYFPSVDTTE